jgi:hypothetical protein
MALVKTVSTLWGFEATNAYHRVENVVLDSKSTISFRVRSYKQNTGVPHFADAGFVCQYDLNATNPLTQAYNHVKTLPEFSGALDC